MKQNYEKLMQKLNMVETGAGYWRGLHNTIRLYRDILRYLTENVKSAEIQAAVYDPSHLTMYLIIQ